eukprot:TRINITY_DN48045_c0_g1_i1.p1 TRINITY_DN48045_c0_g1~~TRINITY_DN48045_c0_g1_i1.p1  ORF type:complete len:646 (+),score=101.20 TRINITY_DN48045_c0_g1_i1:182-2119(+)
MAITTSRAPRRFEFLEFSNSTSELVAPGSYDFPEKVVTESAIPFNSLQEKELNPISSTARITPGPGTYMGQKLPSAAGGDDLPGRGLSTTSFKSNMKRMAPSTPGSTAYSEGSIKKNPGPGTYSISTEIGSKTKPVPIAGTKPILDDIDKSIPSIPQTRFLPGQVPETEALAADKANLSARHTGEPRDMVGPGEYDPSCDQLSSRINAAVAVFHPPPSKEKGLWEPTVAIDCKFAPTENPGPGSYDWSPDNQDAAQFKGASHKFNSKVPMAFEQDLDESKISPGPGSYEMTADIDRMMLQMRERALTMGDRYRFGTVCERVGWNRDVAQPYKDAYNVANVPGPGHYTSVHSTFPDDPQKDVAKLALPGAKKKKFTGVHHPTLILALQEAEGPLQAFSSTDDRPCNKAIEPKTPAPWEYNIETARDSSMAAAMRERAKVGRKGVFGTCADRFYGSPLNGREGLPDPSFDGGGGLGGDGGNETGRSSFKSTSSRMAEQSGPREVQAVKVGNHEVPAPGTYEILNEPNYRSPYRVPRTEHVSFGASKARFQGKQEVFSGHMLPESNPPPGTYQWRDHKKVTGAPKLKDKRKPLHVGCTNEAIGPGSYQTSGTMLKKTYNISTQAPTSARTPRPRYGSNVSSVHAYDGY